MRRLFLAALACAVVASTAHAAATNDEDCPAYREECAEAKALGYRDAGICTVERLECRADPTYGPGLVDDPRKPPKTDVPERRPAVP